MEALEEALLGIEIDDEVQLRVIDRGVGGVTETNVNLASASNAIIIGFNVRAEGKATELANREGVDIRYYSVIYQAIDEIEKALKGMLKPVYEEVELGRAEIRAIFRSSKVGNIAGCLVTSGIMRRNAKARLLRDNVVVAETRHHLLAQAGEGRCHRGSRRLRMRSDDHLQRHQGRRRHRDVRVAREAARLTSSAHSRSTRHRDVRLRERDRPRGRWALMFVRSLEIDLLLGDVRSLKQKRSVVRPILAELWRVCGCPLRRSATTICTDAPVIGVAACAAEAGASRLRSSTR